MAYLPPHQTPPIIIPPVFTGVGFIPISESERYRTSYVKTRDRLTYIGLAPDSQRAQVRAGLLNLLEVITNQFTPAYQSLSSLIDSDYTKNYPVIRMNRSKIIDIIDQYQLDFLTP
jgi:hypothetical protein